MVLSIDPERERISLGIKQLAQDPFSGIATNEAPSSRAPSRKSTRAAVIDLGNGIEGQLRAWLLIASKTRTVLKVGQEIEARFTGVDRKTRTIALSIKAKEMHEEAEAVSSYRSEQGSSSGTSLGDLLKEQIGGER